MKLVTNPRAALLLPALALAAISSPVASAAVYGGSTTQRAPIAFMLAKSGKLKTIRIDWTGSCSGDMSFPFGGALVAAAKAPDIISPGEDVVIGGIKKGRLSATGLGSATLGDGMSAAIVQKIRGRFKPTSASGTWSAHVTILDPEGNSVDSCDTGRFRWSAGRGPTIYAGSTTQGEPVVVRTSKSRTRVDYFGFGWSAPCTPDGYLTFPEGFSGFPLTSSGAFGDQWTSDYPWSDGSAKDSFSYKLAGTLKKGRGSGTLSVDMATITTDGATSASCHTNTVRWSVTQ